MHVRFHRDLVEEVIIYNPIGIKFSPESITEFGLEYQDPDRMDEGVFYNWTSYNGYLNINLYSVGKRPYKGFEEHPGFEIYFSAKREKVN